MRIMQTSGPSASAGRLSIIITCTAHAEPYTTFMEGVAVHRRSRACVAPLAGTRVSGGSDPPNAGHLRAMQRSTDEHLENMKRLGKWLLKLKYKQPQKCM